MLMLWRATWIRILSYQTKNKCFQFSKIRKKKTVIPVMEWWRHGLFSNFKSYLITLTKNPNTSRKNVACSDNVMSTAIQIISVLILRQNTKVFCSYGEVETCFLSQTFVALIQKKLIFTLSTVLLVNNLEQADAFFGLIKYLRSKLLSNKSKCR